MHMAITVQHVNLSATMSILNYFKKKKDGVLEGARENSNRISNKAAWAPPTNSSMAASASKTMMQPRH